MVQRIFRTHKLALLHKSLVLRVLGEMDRDLMNEIEQRLRIALGLWDTVEEPKKGAKKKEMPDLEKMHEKDLYPAVQTFLKLQKNCLAEYVVSELSSTTYT